MNTYIVLLKAINVGGKRIIKMDQLRTVLATLGFDNISTYLQTGNIIFTTKESDLKKIKEAIANLITREFNIETSVLLYPIDQLEDIIHHNPFTNNQTENLSLYHVSFLETYEEQFNKEEIIAKKDESEEIHFSNKAIYLFCPNGYGKTKLHNTFLEKKTNMKVTTRNWKTTVEILNLAKNLVKLDP